jgi:hypothetical protein
MRKGQAALEFLMTYGWAVLVIGAIIVTLTTTGILVPSSDIASSCIFSPGLACEDISIYSDRMYLVLRNGGLDMQLQSVQVQECITHINQPLYASDSKMVTLTGCSFGNRGNQLLEKIHVNYTKIAGTREFIGEVKGIIQ